MSYTLNVEPDIVHKAESYAMRHGTTLDAMIRTCMLIIVSQGDGGEDFDSLWNGMYEPRKSSLKIGSMRDEVRLPEEFDREFDRLDAQVAFLFNGMPS